MFDFPTLLCCFNHANIYCLEITCLLTTISTFPLNLLGIINIRWGFIELYCQILYSVNLATIIFNIFTIVFISLSTASKKVLLTHYYKPFAQIALISAFIFVFLVFSYSISAFCIIMDYSKIKNETYDFSRFNKFDIRKIKDLIKYKKNWVLLYFATLLPIFFSFLNILLWISIYYRIIFRIYCSFNYEIRKELKKVKKREMTNLDEETTSENDKNKINKNEKVENVENIEISVVMEKDRHPSYKNNLPNLKRNTGLGLNPKASRAFNQEFSTGISSTKRDFSGNNNNN